MGFLRLVLIAVGLLQLTVASLHAEEERPETAKFSPEQLQFFENKVRPILVTHCQKCHGEEKQGGSLRLDSYASAMSGGDSGPAIMPHKPEASLLLEAVNYKSLEMPPSGKLSPEDIQTLTDWVAQGAAWPGAESATAIRKKTFEVTPEDRQHWSFQPLRPVSLPAGNASGSSAQTPIDTFVQQRLKEKGLTSSPPASKRNLLRRAFYDVVGLPPTAEEIEAFEADASPDALERIVDQLLASPRYGERWGRHWLDVVRFAQTNGYERDGEKQNAWRYRDYVIAAFNKDKPYNQFLLEQLAGDELPEVTDETLTATGFFRLGVWDDEPDDKKQSLADELDDIVSTTGSSMLGLTLGCSRCHDHKFDPISQEDYYSFTAFFANITPYGKEAETIQIDLPSGQGKTLGLKEKGGGPPKSHILIRGSAATPGKEVQPRFVDVLSSSPEALYPVLPEQAGDFHPEGRKTLGRRTILAQWLTSPANPLPARVIVNRIWQQHFGRGIVPTPSDFGKVGQPPSHRELLDYLANDFIQNDWQIKRLHRQIMTSAVYQQASQADQQPTAVAIDPDNTLLWRQNLRRLEAESIRDSALFVSGSIHYAMGGVGVYPKLSAEVLASQSRPGDGWNNNTSEGEQSRRSVYIFVKRTLGVPLLDTFDSASADTPTPKRNTTTVAPQSLIMLNSDFYEQQARHLADRILQEGDAPSSLLLDRAFRMVLTRLPTEKEKTIALGYLAQQQEQFLASETAKAVAQNATMDRQQMEKQAQRQAMEAYCKVMLNLNEFVYID
ncbi:MAG: PSD1 and planctomycete cytochrome C domain-containing protein [Planctomycetaceae bacterium]